VKSDSLEFLVKTNREVDEWMDSFYTDGHKAEFRSHCQWTWQEQERRKAKLIEALESAASWLEWLDDPRCGLGGNHKAVIKQARTALKEAAGKQS
jgi:hypothetical protein